MPERFEAWVYVVCGGAFTWAAYLLYDPAEPWHAAVPALLAAGFIIWPDRIAFSYRHGKGRPKWTTATSVVDPTPRGTVEPAVPFKDYTPSLRHLFNGYSSIGTAVLPFIWIRDNNQASAMALAVIAAGGTILWFAQRQESSAGSKPRY